MNIQTTARQAAAYLNSIGVKVYQDGADIAAKEKCFVVFYHTYEGEGWADDQSHIGIDYVRATIFYDSEYLRKDLVNAARTYFKETWGARPMKSKVPQEENQNTLKLFADYYRFRVCNNWYD